MISPPKIFGAVWEKYNKLHIRRTNNPRARANGLFCPDGAKGVTKNISATLRSKLIPGSLLGLLLNLGTVGSRPEGKLPIHSLMGSEHVRETEELIMYWKAIPVQ